MGRIAERIECGCRVTGSFDDALAAPVPAGRALIQTLRFTTDALPPEERYRAWRLRDWPRTEPIFRTDPFEPFDTRWESAPLGPIVFARVEITGMRWERRLDDIRRSGFDYIIVNMMKRGEARGDFDGRAFHETADTFHFHDLARPSLHMSTASLTYSLIVPRTVAADWFGALDDLHGLVVPRKDAALAFVLAEQVSEMLADLDADQAERLGRMFLETMAVALASIRPAPPSPVSAAAQLRAGAVEFIESRLGSRELGAEEVAQGLGVSRGPLFAAFQADGGVRAYTMTRRLERARAALADLEQAEPVGLIAERLGFADAPHLTRTFRARYGMTPGQYRRLLRADREMPSTETDAHRVTSPFTDDP